MAVVLGLHGRVDPDPRLEFDWPSGPVVRTATVFGAAPSLSGARPVMVNSSCPLRPSEAALSPSANWRGRTPIPIRLERWMRSKLSAITARIPSRAVPLAAQSRDEPDPYSLPASTTSGTPSAA